MYISKKLAILTALILSISNGFSQNSKRMQIDSLFNSLTIKKGSIVTYHLSNKEYFRYNPSMCNTGYLPASTFKIPNSLIALELGIVSDVNQIIKWDNIKSSNESCNSDQTLASALKNSCIWVYSEFANKIGINQYKDYINKIDYGNKQIDYGPKNRFWLEGDFKISADQQVEFLKKFHNYELPFSKGNIDDVKKLILLRDTPNFKLSGKAGTEFISNKEVIVWFIGYVEMPNETVFFSINFIHHEINSTSKIRGELLSKIFNIIL